MPSPFPGMDPYIEQCGLWGDFHNHLIEKISDQLAAVAPERYFVRTDERYYIMLMDTNGKDSHSFLPDVSMSTPRKRRKPSRSAGPAVAELPSEIEPVTLRAFIDEEHRERFIEIYEAEPEKRLVTCIEVLSPTNKRPGTDGWELYLRKRQSILLSNVNLVEIDLLRGGQRMPMLDPWPDSPYVIMVARAMNPQNCKVWPTYFQRPLQPIPVPLTKPDPALSLDLQLLINGIYDRYRYSRTIDYTRPLSPPLTEEETAWLKQRFSPTARHRRS